MASTISLVPIQALASLNRNGVQMTGPFILVKTSPETVAQQVKAQRRLKKQEPISPKPELLRCKRRTDGKGLHNLLPKPLPAAVARRNERERNRVRMVNLGFETLREHVPEGKKNKKLSKVDTLKSAVDYIRQLQELLQYTDEATSDRESETDSRQTPSPVNHEDATPLTPSNRRCETTCMNYENNKDHTRNVYPSDIIGDQANRLSYQNDKPADNVEISYQHMQTFNFNNPNTAMMYDTGSTQPAYANESALYEALCTNSGFSATFSDQPQYYNSYNAMQHSPATSYVSMQHSPTTSENMSESFSSEEDELTDLRSFFPL